MRNTIKPRCDATHPLALAVTCRGACRRILVYKRNNVKDCESGLEVNEGVGDRETIQMRILWDLGRRVRAMWDGIGVHCLEA